MARQLNVNETISKNIAFFDNNNSSYDSINSSYPITNGLGGADDEDYAYFYINTGFRAETWIYYGFDFSDIPENAIITSVSCRVKGYINTTNSSRITTRTIAAYNGTTQKGSTSTISTNTNAITLSVGSWTKAELQNAKIGIHVIRGTSNISSNYHVRFYGATMTVDYSVSGTAYTITTSSPAASTTITPGTNNIAAEDTTTQLYVKENNVWRTYSKVYKKINGSWVEQSDLSNVFSTTANYVKQS